eukprot:g11295.t1
MKNTEIPVPRFHLKATSISPTASAGRSSGADEEEHKFGFLANKAAAKAKGSVLDRIKQLEKGNPTAKQGGSTSNTAPAAKKFLAPDRRKQVQPDEAPKKQLDNKQLPSEQPQEPPTTNTAIEDVGAALAAALSAKLELSDSAEELQPLAAAMFPPREDQEQVPLTAPSRSDPVKVDSCPPPPQRTPAEAVRASSESGAPESGGAAGGAGAFSGTSAEATAGAVCREGQQEDEEPKEAAGSRQLNNDEDEQMSEEVAAEGGAEEPPSKPEEEGAVVGEEGAEVGQREQKEVEVENSTPSLVEQATATREETAAAAVTGPVFKGESTTSPSGSEKSPAGNQMDVDEEEVLTIIPPDEAAAGEMLVTAAELPEASAPRGLAEKEGAPVEGRGAATGSTTTAAEPAGAAEEEPTQPYQKAKVSARVAFFEKFSSGSQKNSGK